MYSNIQLTLDNPAVLEQKLEALEHHKRVLENQRRAQLNASGKYHAAISSTSTSEAPPPEPPLATHPEYARSFRQPSGNNGAAADASASTAPNGNKFNETIYANQQQLYENVNRANKEYPGESDDDQAQSQQQHINYANYRNVASAGDADGRHLGGREPSTLIYGNVKAIGNNTGGSLTQRSVMQPSQAELVNPYSNYSYSERRSQGKC